MFCQSGENQGEHAGWISQKVIQFICQMMGEPMANDGQDIQDAMTKLEKDGSGYVRLT